MEENTGRKYWIIIAVVLGLLFACGAGAIAGGFVGYFAGRRAARYQYEYSPGPYRYVLPPTPVPEIPEPGEPEELPELPFVTRGGALVTEVVEGSPADRAGVRKGDVIVEVDGQPIEADADLADIISKYDPGDELELQILRAGRLRTLTVELGRNRDKPGNTPWLGLYYRWVPAIELERSGD